MMKFTGEFPTDVTQVNGKIRKVIISYVRKILLRFGASSRLL
jgi:hypothetical protein